jgi:N-acyl-D-aspartate/D-glutamate deacylase
MLDLKIVGGVVIDGTGRPGFRGDVGVRDGRIVAVGEVAEPARETLDAAGRAVAPGFIDVHTHYDAQAFWDPTFSPSCYHGVTTIVGGFCGFSIAPMTPQAAPYIQRMLSRVEGMPLQTLQEALPWDWSSFGDYLAKLDGKVGLNAGFFAGHSAIRRIAMGERAVGERAGPEDLERMKALLGQALADGALGLSSTVSPTHNDYEGAAVPSRWAERAEFVELARVVSRHEGTGLELLPDLDFGQDMVELLAEVSIAGQRPVNWNVLMVSSRPDAAATAARLLAASDYARARGGEVIALTMPCTPEIYQSLRTGVMFDALPGVWRELFKLPLDERIAAFQDADVRRRMAEDAAKVPAGAALEVTGRLEGYTVVSVQAERNRSYQGRKVGEIAAELGRAPIDVMLDIAVEDRLETLFAPDYGGHDQESYELRGRIWADDRTLVGASDAGAHLDLIDSFAFATVLLQKGVREHRVIGLEEAVRQITHRPAVYFGLVDRGLIAAGHHADLVVFDPQTVGRGPTYQRYDVPGGCDYRLYADARGIDHVFVNGVQIVRDGAHTGALPGTVLRSGRDTRTVALDALREPGAAVSAAGAG